MNSGWIRDFTSPILFHRKENKNFENAETLKVCSSQHGILALNEVHSRKSRPPLKCCNLIENRYVNYMSSKKYI